MSLAEIGFCLFFLVLIIGAAVGNGDAVLPVTLLVMYLGLLWLRNRRERERTQFRQQVRSHRNELRAGTTVMIDGILLRRETEITTYQFSVGLILALVTIPSPYRLVGRDQEALLYSVLSVVAGWWAFPGGPAKTLANISANLQGGKRETIASFYERPVAAS